MKKQKGITLIALVITIIVMLILVGVTISVSLKGGLFTTAKKSTDETQIAKEKEELLMAAMGTLEESGKVDFNKLDNNLPSNFAKISEGKYESSTGNKYQVVENGNIILLDGNVEEEPEIPEGTIPEGGTYYVGVTANKVGNYTGATNVLSQGDSFPNTPKTGDVYVYGDYEYRYNYMFIGSAWWNSETDDDVQQCINQGIAAYGWSVRVVDKTKTEYGQILESINGNSIKNLAYTFYDCSNMEKAPEIPSDVICLESTYNACVKMTTAPSVIPLGVKNMAGTFTFCNELTGTITIDATPITYVECMQTYSNGKSVTITGKCGILDKIAATEQDTNRITII